MKLPLMIRLFGAHCALACCVMLGCSKSNDVDISEGDLPAGAACTAGPEDRCAGACFDGSCRSLCGSNRECPASMSCVGDGARAVCVPAGSVGFDLLADCSQGCEVPLAPFGREGYFRRCDSEPFTSTQALGSAIDAGSACSSVGERAFGVKNEVLYEIDDGPCSWTRLGMANDGVLVSHACVRDEYRGQFAHDFVVSTLGMGQLLDSGGESYLLFDRFAAAPWGGGEYRLYKFEPGSAEDVPTRCEFDYASDFGGSTPDDPSICPEPVFPATGDPASDYAGFWVQCATEVLVEATPEAAATCDTSDFEAGGGSVLHLRSDGYGTSGQYPDSCNQAFRVSVNGSVATLGRPDAPLGVLTMQVRPWLGFETDDGTFLWTGERWEMGFLYKLMTPPADFQDPCDYEKPDFSL